MSYRSASPATLPESRVFGFLREHRHDLRVRDACPLGIVGVVALVGVTGSRAEVAEVAARARRVVFVVAGRRALFVILLASILGSMVCRIAIATIILIGVMGRQLSPLLLRRPSAA